MIFMAPFNHLAVFEKCWCYELAKWGSVSLVLLYVQPTTDSRMSDSCSTSSTSFSSCSTGYSSCSTAYSSCSTAYSSCSITGYSTATSGSSTAASFLTADTTAQECFPKLYSFPAKAVAEELTLLDASMLRMIKTSELEDGVWMKKDKVCWYGFAGLVTVWWCRVCGEQRAWLACVLVFSVTFRKLGAKQGGHSVYPILG